MLRNWRAALRAAARAPSASAPHASSSSITTRSALPAVAVRSFAMQAERHAASSSTTASSPTSSALPSSPPPRKRKSHEKSSAPSNRVSERVLAAPESSYSEALRAFEYLRDHKAQLRERHFLALVEKASVEHEYDAVRAHFAQYCAALQANRIALYRSPKTSWGSYQSERLQLHRHMLWAMLQSGAPATRFRAMQRHYRKHELASKLNRLGLYESDALNFLLRMECTFTVVDPRARNQGSESWLARVATILDEMRAQKFRTNYSSSHALFHFMMRRPDVAMLDKSLLTDDEEDRGHNSADRDQEERKPTDESEEDQAVHRVLNALFDQYPETLERDPRRMSLAVSTAASAGRVGLAVGLLRDADTRGVAVDAASFAHVVAMAKDEASRIAIADLYMRAKEHDRIYESEDNHSMKTYLLLYAIHDGNFTQIMELLHEMEYNKIPASPHTVAMLFASVAKYRARIRHKFRHRDDPSQLEAALKECPSVAQLMANFPTVIDRNTHTGSQSILQALRSGDIDVALSVLRTTVQVAKVRLRAEVFSQVLYAVLATDATSKRDVLVTHQVEQLFDTQHPGQRDHLNAQLLNLCESNNDLETMVAVLDNWHANPTGPLSKRALNRVFDVISSHLKAIRSQDKLHDGKQAEDEQARYKLGSLELSFCGVLEKYPMLVPLDRSTVGTALMRSASAKLVNDVATLLSVAHAKNISIEPVVYKASLDVLHEACRDDPESRAYATLREAISSMEANGAWTTICEEFPEFAARLSE